MHKTYSRLRIAACIVALGLSACTAQDIPAQQAPPERGANMKLLNIQAGECKLSVEIDSKSEIISNDIKRTNTEPALLHLATVSVPDSAAVEAVLYYQFFALENNDDKNVLRMRARFLLETQGSQILEEFQINDTLYLFARSDKGKYSDYHFREFEKNTIISIRTLLNANPKGPQPESPVFESLSARDC